MNQWDPEGYKKTQWYRDSTTRIAKIDALLAEIRRKQRRNNFLFFGIIAVIILVTVLISVL
jgi:hypothetical protein